MLYCLKNITIAYLFSLQIVSFSSASSLDFSKSFSLIKVAKQRNDIRSPWKKKNIVYEHHLASCIKFHGRNALLVTSYAILNQTEILMLPYFQSKKIPLEPVFVDHEVNLAILIAKEGHKLTLMKPVPIGDDISIGSTATILTDQNNIKLNKHSATLSAVDIYEASTSSYQMVHYLLKAQQKSLGWSEPVIKNEKIVAITSGQNSDYIYAVPARTIKHFLSEKVESYRGFPSLGLLTQSFNSDSLRQALGAPGQELGVRVAKVNKTSPFFKKIKKNDVLLAFNDYKINSRQTIEHSIWGEIPYVVLVNEKYAGDLVRLTFWRDKKEFHITEPLRRYSSNEKLVRQYNYKNSESHLIFGGLIFQELSLDYLKTWGSHWQKEAKSDLLYHWVYKNDFFPAGNKRIVILSKVLADRKNHGYEHLTHRIINKINGFQVNSIQEVFKALENPIKKQSNEYAKIEFSQGKGEVILSYKDLASTHTRIANSYGITSPQSFFSRKPNKP
ncbi:MAG: PDZ domain-containing protein [Oligoflexales bacterium]